MKAFAVMARLSVAAVLALTGCSGADTADLAASSIVVASSATSDESAADPVQTTTSGSAQPSESASVSAIPETLLSSPPVESSAVVSTTASTTTAAAAPTTSAEPEVGDTGGAELPALEGDPNAPFTGNPDNLVLTAPGSQLKFADTATIPFANGEADGVFTIKGISLTKGSQSDWAALGIDADTVDGAEPWFLRMSVTQVGGSKFSYPSVEDDLWAYTSEDLINTMYPDDAANSLCPLSSVPDTFTIGDSYQACVILTVIPGTSVDRVQFEGGWADNDPYLNSPIVWKP